MSERSRAPSAGRGGCAGIPECYETANIAPSADSLDRGASSDIVGTMSRILSLFAVICLAVSSASVAQRPTILGLRLGEDAALWQARSCVGEVGWNAPDEACVAMAWIHAKRAKLTGVSLTTMVRAYSVAVREPRIVHRASAAQGSRIDASVARSTTRSRVDRRRQWVQGLSVTGAAPRGWPEGLRGAWPRYQARFREIYELVNQVLSGDTPDPCPNATFYGGPMDSPPSGHEVDDDCSFDGTAQVFYRRFRSEDS